jgi:predicted RNA-binding Zn-ribbon protein involved in translation (DUF1610 family)
MQEQTSFVLRVSSDLPGGGAIIEPTLKGDFLICPHCGNDDIGMWADDGEADDADYMDCHQCGIECELVRRDDHALTVNGIKVVGA